MAGAKLLSVALPIDLQSETNLDASCMTWLAFAVQKLMNSRSFSAGALNYWRESVAKQLMLISSPFTPPSKSHKVHNSARKQRCELSAELAFTAKSLPSTAAIHRPALQFTGISNHHHSLFSPDQCFRQARKTISSGPNWRGRYQQQMQTRKYTTPSIKAGNGSGCFGSWRGRT